MMTPDRTPSTGMTTRQKVTIVGFIIVLLIILWQVYGLFSSGGTITPTPTPAATTPVAAMPQAPKPAPIPQQPPVLSQREAEILKLQQETEAKYLAALNELQVLRVERDIAETNRAIMAAKLDTITSQKGIVDLLKPPAPTQPTMIPPGAYAQSLAGPGGEMGTATATPTPPQATTPPPAATTVSTTTTVTVIAPYTVISVSQLQNRWSAVLGFQGNLFNVMVGDVLPPDQSRVININRSGVVLQKNGTKRKISLVPII